MHKYGEFSLTSLIMLNFLAGISEEVGSKPKGVEILGMKVVLFRGKDGKIRCINDVCPHRGAPLHMGWVSEVCSAFLPELPSCVISCGNVC
jgi:Rieske [2Fe-2S] domain